MKQTIYIAGKVTGEPLDICTNKFFRIQELIETLGHETINPLQVVGDFDTPWEKAMRKCIKALMDADAIYTMPDTLKSKGANTELALARILGLIHYTSLEEIPKVLNIPPV